MNELMSKMKSEVEKTCEAFQSDLEYDKAMLLDDFRPCMSYIWVVKKAGTELMPENLAFCRNNYYNILAYGCAEESENKAFRIDLKAQNMTTGEIFGEITEISDLKGYLDANQMTPETIRYKYLLVSGEIGEHVIPYTDNYFEDLLSVLNVMREDIYETCVTQVN